MEVKFYWKITRIEVLPSYDKLTYPVKRVCYEVTGVCQETEEYCSLAGETVLLDANQTNFIPYFELTEEKVLQWVKTSIGTQTVHDHETEIKNQLKDLVKPKLVELDLPWEIKEREKVVNLEISR